MAKDFEYHGLPVKSKITPADLNDVMKEAINAAWDSLSEEDQDTIEKAIVLRQKGWDMDGRGRSLAKINDMCKELAAKLGMYMVENGIYTTAQKESK